MGHELREREREMQAAQAAVDLVCGPSARGGLLIYSGAAGLGKTTLLNEVHGLAAPRATVLRARGSAVAAGAPFDVVRQLLRPALTGRPPGRTRELFGSWYGIAGPALGLAAPRGPHADPRGVNDGIDHVFTQLARGEGPLVVLIDDAHGADTESLDWLAAFAPQIEQAKLPLLVVLVYRPEEAADPGQVLRGLTLSASARPVGLVRLSPEAVTEMVRSTLGEDADDAFCTAVFDVTSGNPYETVELLAEARGVGLRPHGSSADRLEALGAAAHGSGLIPRITQLGPHAMHFAQAAAILDIDMTEDLVAKLATLNATETASCVKQLREARILGSGPDLEFFHPLIATAVYRSMSDAVRTAMHGTAATLLAQEGRGAAAVARHLIVVHPDGDPDLVRQLREAARHHLAVGAPDAARRCLKRALTEPPLPGDRAGVLFELGCATLLTSPGSSVAKLSEALSLDGLPDGLRIDAAHRLAQALAHNNQLEEAAEAAARAAAEAPPGTGRTRLEAAHFLYEMCQFTETDGPARARRLAERADGLPGDDNAERSLLVLRAFDAMLRGESAELVGDLCDRAVVDGRLAPGLGWTDTDWGMEIPLVLGATYAYIDRIDRAEALFDDALRTYEISGWSGWHLAFAHAFYGMAQHRKGRLAAAEEYLRESLRLADRLGRGLPLHWNTTCLLVDTLLARGKVAEAEQLAEDYEFGPPYPSGLILPDGPSVRGRLMLAKGQTAEAVEQLATAGRWLAERGRDNPIWGPWIQDLVPVIAADEPERAAELVATVRERAERFGTPTALAEALMCAAVVAGPEEAADLLDQAVDHLTGSLCRHTLARALVAHGEALLATGERDRALDRLRRGADLAADCSADALAARARGRAAEAGGTV
ncbi:ATP-binding protein [Streptomyces sp. NPDC060194]|uniref:ATP-binding protein n=1 Tax=Streptomyces sp. NPDC060194 TaxID=3347069 RepID=UPI0036591F23